MGASRQEQEFREALEKLNPPPENQSMAEIVQKLAKQELAKGLPAKLAQETEVKGGRVNYYLVHVDHPQREDQEPYQAECEDIIEALELNPDEANIFKEIWRGANARKHNGKPGHTALYGAQKIVHYAGRILRRISRTS